MPETKPHGAPHGNAGSSPTAGDKGPVSITINGIKTQVSPNTVVAAALAIAGIATTRRSVTGLARGPLCGMGICFECRATIDGQPNLRTCNILCREGMEVRTDG